MYAVVFFILLWTLFQVILCETLNYECGGNYTKDPYFLYLLETNDSSHREINENFLHHYLAFVDAHNDDVPFHPKPIRLRDCSSRYEDLKKETNSLKYVIHLHVEDFYQNNYNDVILSGFSWAGDIDSTTRTKETVCKFNGTFREDGIETCIPDTIEQQKHVKLVSEKVMSISFLSDLVLSIKYPAEPKLYKEVYYRILLCAPKVTHSSYNSSYKLAFDDIIIRIKSYRTDKCNVNFGGLDREIIAIIAPNPSAIHETNKPVLFYEEPYILPGNTAFYNNSIIRVRSWKALSKTFLGFIRRMRWERVAVLSDDSIASVAFEEELRKVFDKGGVSYIVMTVTETNQRYNFLEALTGLKQADARIIIANVDDQHAHQLAQQIKNYGMEGSQMLWLARDWSAETAKSAAKIMGTVYTVSPKRTSIDTFLGAIDNVINLNYYNKSYDYLNSKIFANDIRRRLGSIDETLAQVTVTKPNDQHRVIASYINHKWDLYKPFPRMPKDRKDDCSIRSSNFIKPCDDLIVIFFMLVIVVTSVTVLGITYFFQTSDTPYNRMAN